MHVFRMLISVALFCVSAFAVTGTFTQYTMTWNGLTRTYGVYQPAGLVPNSAMVVVLHPTSPANPPQYFRQMAWESLSNSKSFLVVWPLSTYNTRVNHSYWDCFFLDYSFPVHPDDTGFVRNVILTVASQYGTDPKRVFVTGMSSGAFMAHRVGVDSSDLVAAIAPVSGMYEVQPSYENNVVPNLLYPVSVFELHGDHDTAVPYCGAKKQMWGEPDLLVPSLDATSAYWRTQNACTDAVPNLCTNGRPTVGVDGLDAKSCTNGVEVQVVREVGVGHVWVTGTETTVWNFFSTHARR